MVFSMHIINPPARPYDFHLKYNMLNLLYEEPTISIVVGSFQYFLALSIRTKILPEQKAPKSIFRLSIAQFFTQKSYLCKPTNLPSPKYPNF